MPTAYRIWQRLPLSYHAARALSIFAGDLPLRVEACRFLSENKSAGAIDKPARQEYAVVNKDARSWLQRTFLESRYGLRPRRLKSYERRGLPFIEKEKPLCLLDKAADLHIMESEGRCR